MNNVKTLFFLFCSLFLAINSQAQDSKYTISGYVEDADTGEKLIAANVYDPEKSKGAVTNVYGFYSLTLEADSVYLAVSYLGYETQFFRLKLDKDLNMNFQLKASETLAEVEIVAEKLERIEEKTQMSTLEIPISQIKRLPSLLGEVDVLKALQLMPGVQSGGEGTSGLYVRGGSPDQNLILLDGAPVYNVSHLFGFFSVFNADAIKNVRLTKGGYPARFGGRLSSVLEIDMKEGNTKKIKGTGTIGLIASKLTLEGPIIKDKTSFIVSARRTYADLLAKPFIKRQSKQDDDADFSGGYHFYDINAKINHKFSDKDRLYLSAYAGEDKFKVNVTDRYQNGETKNRFGLDWGNITSSLRWNHVWNNKLFSNVRGTFSRYRFDTNIGIEDTEYNGSDPDNVLIFGAKYLSGIEDFAGSIDFDYVPNPGHFIRFGMSGTHHTFKPGALQFSVTENTVVSDTTLGTTNLSSGEFSAYIEDDFSIGKNFKVNLGVHASAFLVEGTGYFSAQPRLGMRYLLPKSYAVKASFATMTQYLHLLSNEGIGLPTDLWLPSTKRVKPESSWQTALGVAKTFKDKFEVSIEAYYKKMDNLIAYKEGADFLGFSDWQDKIEIGKGESYGVELFVQKKFGKTTGWMGYTLSWSDRTFENINAGKTYPFKYDRRHDISVVVMHEFNDRIRISGTWVYGTGNAITLPISQSRVHFPRDEGSGYGGFVVQNPEEKNSFRQASYHRMDIGADFIKQKKRYERRFTVGFYNIYNRKNPFFIYADDNSTNRRFRAVSLFPILPSFSWGFTF